MWKAILLEKKRKTMTLSKRKGVIAKKQKGLGFFSQTTKKQAKGVE